MAGKPAVSQNQLVSPAMREIEAQQGPLTADIPLVSSRSGGGIIALAAVVLAGALGTLAVLTFDSIVPILLTAMAFLASLGFFYAFWLWSGNLRIAAYCGLS